MPGGVVEKLTLHNPASRCYPAFVKRINAEVVFCAGGQRADFGFVTVYLILVVQLVFGDAVAILAENSSHWAIAYFAITSMGAVAVPILIEFHSDAIIHIIRHSEAKAVFVSDRLFPKIADAVFNPAPLFISLESFLPISQGMTRDTLVELKSKGLREFRK